MRDTQLIQRHLPFFSFSVRFRVGGALGFLTFDAKRTDSVNLRSLFQSDV